MTHKFWQRAFSTLLLLGWIVGLVQPASVNAATLPQSQTPGGYTTPEGFYVSEPFPTADTKGLPPAPAPEVKAGAVEHNSALPMPKSGATTESQTKDPVAQTQPGTVNMPAPIMNFEGIANTTGIYPPDTDGQVGPVHYVQIVNNANAGAQVRVWNKTTGVQLYDYGMGDLWPASDPCNVYAYGDPVVLYDQIADRWILTQFALPDPPYYECFAVSKTGVPTNNPNDWSLYSFLVSNTNMNDYPKIGVWPDGYYMMVHQFAGGLSWAGTGVFVFERDKMLNGQPATFQYKDLNPLNTNYGGMLPSNLMGDTLPPAGTPNYYVEVDQNWYGATDVMTVFGFHVDWANPVNTKFGRVGELAVAEFDLDLCTGTREQCIDQPGTSVRLEAISDRLMMHAWYRNMGDHEVLVFNHTVDGDGAGHAGIRWYEVRKTNPAIPTIYDPPAPPATLPWGPWSIYQQGTYFPDTNHRWMGSIAMDHVGNMALGYSLSSTTINPSIRYTGRLTSDPLGTLPQAEVQVIAGSGSQTGTAARWGDYSAMSVDPIDDCTFWYTQEYIQTTGAVSWQTRVASFKFPNCSIGPMGTLKGKVTNTSNGSPIAGATVDATASITQTGSTTTNGTGDYLMHLLVGTYAVTASAYGFLPNTVTGIQVMQNVTTTQNLALTPAGMQTVQGTVTDANTGWPLYAKITIDGYPGAPLWTNPVTGHYSVDLATGILYTFHVEAWVPGYLPHVENVGPLVGPITKDFALDVNTATCNAPGYRLVGGFSENFDSVTPPALPTGWAKVDVNGTTGDWRTNAGTVHPSGGGTHSAPNLVYFNSWTASSGNSTRLYRTIPVNMTALPSSDLTFWMFHDTGYSSLNDRVQVQVSTNGGTSWVNVGTAISRYNGTVGWAQHTVGLSAYSTETNLLVGLLGISNYGNDVHVDDITLGGTPTCTAPIGGLVVGNVYDANTDAPLVGAAVSNDSGRSTTTVANPDDLAQAPAFYTLFSPAQQHVFTATISGGYGADVKLVTVVGNNTVGQDFYLPAGKLTYIPPALTATLELGASTTQGLTLTNEGGLPVNWELIELDKGFQPHWPTGRPPYKPRAKSYWDATETAPAAVLKAIQNASPNVWGTGAPIPTGARYRAAGASCDGKTYYVFGGQSGAGVVLSESWKYDPGSNSWTALAPMPVALMNMDATCINGYIYLVGGYTGSAHTNAFQIYDTNNNIWASSTWPNVRTPMTSAWNGLLFAFGGNPGPSGETWMYNPGTGVWIGPLAAMPTPESYGAATTVGDYIFYVGGGSIGTDVQRYDPANNTWDATGPALPAIRMNAIAVWYGDKLYVASGGGLGGNIWSGYNNTLVLDYSAWPGGSWVDQGEIVPTPVVGAAYDCTADRIYAAGGTSATIYYDVNQYLDDAQTCHFGTLDVPWLSESPITGTIQGYAAYHAGTGATPLMPDQNVPNPGIQLKSPDVTPVPVNNQPVNPNAVLWDQPVSAANQAAYVDQDFPDFPAFSSFLADDFVNSGPWTINTIFIPGDFWNLATTFMNATSLHWAIYADNAGVPAGYPTGGAPPLWSIALPPTDPQITYSTGTGGYPSNTTLNLTTPVVLPPGHYWLMFYPTMGFGAAGQYGRQPADTTNGYVGQLINPGGGFGLGTSWQNWTVLGATQQDIAFRLEGLAQAPHQVVDVTFDAGVPAITQPGNYYAQLKIKNNTPYVVPNVPVTMTVTAPASWGKLEGTVTGLGYCDSDPKPITDTQVVIEPSAGQPITLTTDENGYYSFWLDANLSPLTVSALAPDHTLGLATGVMVSAGMTTTQDFDLRWLKPCVGVVPKSFDVQVASGFSQTESLLLSNSGAAALDWQAVEVPSVLIFHPSNAPEPAPVTGPTTRQKLNAPHAPTNAPAKPTADIIQDGGFEAGTPNPYWQEFSTNFGTPICDLATCGSGGGTAGPHAGNYWVWFGGISAYEHGYVSQALVIPAGTATLSFWFWIGTTGGPVADYFNVLVDGHEVFRATANQQPQYSSYTLVTVDISNYADGAQHTVMFNSEIMGTMTTNFNLDDVVLDSQPLSDIPWLTVNPVAGTVGADSHTDVELTFTALPTMTLGTYNGTLRIKSNDPTSDVVNIPLTMTVVAPAYGVAISGNMSQTALPRSVVTYTVSVTNTGNGPVDTYNMTLGTHTWTTTIDKATVGPLAQGASAQVKVTVHIPAGAAGGAFDAVQVTATSQHDATKHATTTLTTHATTVYGVTLTPATDAKSGAQGATIDYTLHITNTGNVANTFTFAASDNAWVVVVPSPVILNAGASATVVVHVTIPSIAGLGDSDTVTITASGAGGASASSILTTTVNMMKIYLPIITKDFHS